MTNNRHLLATGSLNLINVNLTQQLTEKKVKWTKVVADLKISDFGSYEILVRSDLHSTTVYVDHGSNHVKCTISPSDNSHENENR